MKLYCTDEPTIRPANIAMAGPMSDPTKPGACAKMLLVAEIIPKRRAIAGRTVAIIKLDFCFCGKVSRFRYCLLASRRNKYAKMKGKKMLSLIASVTSVGIDELMFASMFTVEYKIMPTIPNRYAATMDFWSFSS